MCAASQGAGRRVLQASGSREIAPSARRSAATADFLDARPDDLCTGAQRRQIEVRVVLLQQPQGQLRPALRQRPHRVAGPRDANLRPDDSVRGEVGSLELAVILVAQRLEY